MLLHQSLPHPLYEPAPHPLQYMFTGIVLGTGRVTAVSDETGHRSSRMMDVDLAEHADGLEVGHSVAVNGVCLTATRLTGTVCTFEMIQETISATALADLRPGDAVNIERSLRVGDRLEGHYVLGHVDGTGIIGEMEEAPGEVRVRVRVPPDLAAHTVRKGSIAVDGISLTITESSPDSVAFSLIPHTIQTTNFRHRRAGDRVNIETDILGKYALKENIPV